MSMAKELGGEFMELAEPELGLEGRVRAEARREHSTGEYQEQRYHHGCGNKDSHGPDSGDTIHIMFL